MGKYHAFLCFFSLLAAVSGIRGEGGPRTGFCASSVYSQRGTFRPCADLEWDYGANVRLFLESVPEKSKNAALSAQIAGDTFYLAAGSRYLPGPTTAFLLKPDLYSGLPGIPSGRSQNSLFVSLFPGILPGFFFLEGSRSTGFFFAHSDRLFLAAHPESGLGALTLNLPFSHETRFYADILRTRETGEGLFLFSSAEKESPVKLRVEGERRASWDRVESQSETAESRKGRSGLGYFQAGLFDRLELEAGGQDIGRTGMRMGGVQIKQNLIVIPGQICVRGRMYRIVSYGAEVEAAVQGAGALGYCIEADRNDFSIFAESRNGQSAFDFSFGYSGNNFQIRAGAAYGNFSERSFLFLESPEHFSAGVKFLENTKGAFVFQIKSKWIYLYAMSVWNPRPSTFVSLQARFEL